MKKGLLQYIHQYYLGFSTGIKFKDFPKDKETGSLFRTGIKIIENGAMFY